MHARIYGTEIEYGVFSWELVPDRLVLPDFLELVREAVGRFPAPRNGSRIYMDRDKHPEYCTPECLTPLDVVLYERAGESILERLFREPLAVGGASGAVRLYRTSDDKKGTTQGYHENYLMRRAENPDGKLHLERRERKRIIRSLLPFFVTRVIYTGSGNVNDGFEISGRAKFIDEEAYVFTHNNRPIVHMKDEPLSERSKYRRLHVIVGDTNLSEISTFLKIGATSLVLDLVEDGLSPGLTLANPVEALHRLSRRTEGWTVTLEDGRTMSAVDLQRAYLGLARQHLERGCPHDAPELLEMNQRILGLWERTLDVLEHDSTLMASELDWIVERKLLESLIGRKKLSWEHPEVAKADLRFHELGERSLFALLQAKGHVRRLLTDEQIAQAVESPPATRARGRALFVQRLAERGLELNAEVEMWTRLGDSLGGDTKRPVLPIPDPFHTYEEEVEAFVAREWG